MRQHPSPTQLVDDVLTVRAAHAEQHRTFFAMSPAQRVAAMWRTLRRDGQPGVPMHTLYLWASRLPDEVPLIDGEFAFIAVFTPEYAERAADSRQRAGSTPGP